MIVRKHNEVFLKIDCEQSVAYELSEYFTFFVPGYKFTPAYRNKLWDGKIRLFNRQTRQIYHGLLDYIGTFASERGYDIEYDDASLLKTNFSIQEAHEFAESLNIHSRGKKLEVRDYQTIGFAKAIRNKRQLLLSPHGIRQISHCLPHRAISAIQGSARTHSGAYDLSGRAAIQGFRGLFKSQ